MIHNRSRWKVLLMNSPVYIAEKDTGSACIKSSMNSNDVMRVWCHRDNTINSMLKAHHTNVKEQVCLAGACMKVYQACARHKSRAGNRRHGNSSRRKVPRINSTPRAIVHSIKCLAWMPWAWQSIYRWTRVARLCMEVGAVPPRITEDATSEQPQTSGLYSGDGTRCQIPWPPEYSQKMEPETDLEVLRLL